MRMNPMVQFIRQLSGKIGSNLYTGMYAQTDPHHISFLRKLQKEMKAKNSLDRPLDDLKVVVFDLETTGFFPERGDQILSIGAIKMTGEKIENDETFYSLVKYESSLSSHVVELTKITEEQLRTAPSMSEVFIKFYKFIEGRILVAHHAKHEWSFMEHVSWKLMRTKFEHRLVDTSFLIRLVDPKLNELSLDSCCIHCGVEVKNRHHALGDAKMTAQIWSHYIKEAQKMGFKNLYDVYEHLAKIR